MSRLCIGLLSLALTTVTFTLHAAEGLDDSKAFARKMAREFFSDKAEYKQLEGRLTLAQGGKTEYVIVVDKAAPRPVTFAADELAGFLKRMTGAEFKIVHEVPGHGRAIVLGDCPATRRVGLDTKAIARDGYRIITRGNTVFVAGRDDDTGKSAILDILSEAKPVRGNKDVVIQKLGPTAWDFHRGTLYGTYRLLEELGCRWYLPGRFGEVVPQNPTLVMQAFDLWDEPAFKLRTVGPTVWDFKAMGSAIKQMKNVGMDLSEYRELGWSGKADRLFRLRNRTSSEWFAFNHRPTRAEFPERFAEDHPEYFALLASGKRDVTPKKGHWGHLCYTSDGMLRETLADIDAFFGGKTAMSRGMSEKALRRYPDSKGWEPNAFYGRTMSLLPGDGLKACQCPQCKPLQRPKLPYVAHNSNYIWPFVARVGAYMEEKHPGTIAVCLAYSSYSEVPDNVDRLPDNVMVGLCPAYLTRVYNLADPAKMNKLVDLANRWNAKSEMPLMIWGHQLFRWRRPQHTGVPMQLTHFWPTLFRNYAQFARIVFMQLDADSVMFEHMNRYVMLRLLYNPNTDVGELHDDYVQRFYGNAAPVAGPMLEDIERRCTEIARKHYGRIDIYEKVFTEDVIKGYREQADRAVKLAAGTEAEGRVAMFSKHYIGLMEKGFARYDRDVRKLVASGKATRAMHKADGAIAIDGSVDEKAWKASEVSAVYNNVDTEKTEARNEVRYLWDEKNIYVAFTCWDPNARNLSRKEGEADWVEVFLDVEHDGETFYQILVDTEGRLRDWYFQGGGEPPDAGWESGTEVAARRYDDRWVMELRIPRKNLGDAGLKHPGERPWGVNLNRTMLNPPREKDRYASFSPLMRGKFGQPDLFCRVYFKE